MGKREQTKLIKAYEKYRTKKGKKNVIKNDKNSVVTPEFICKLHEVSFGWIFPQWAGKYRKIQVTFSGKEAPQYFDVPILITNLYNDLEERLKYLPANTDEQFILEI